MCIGVPTRPGCMILLLTVLLSATDPVGVRAMDFQLHSTTKEEDGFTREITFFQGDDQTRISINLPIGWAHADDVNTLTLTSPATMPGNVIRLEKSGFSPGLVFKDSNLEKYRRFAFASIPEGATAVHLVEEHDNPLRVFHWTDYEFVLEYEYFGEAYRRCVMFLNLDARQQLIVTALARKTAYERVHTTMFDVLQSWQPIPAS